MNWNSRKLKGITQSQTLLIMGIVFLAIFSIIAVPFYQSIKQKETITKLKTIHSKLFAANWEYATRAYGDIGEFDLTLPLNKFAETYFTPYMDIEHFCKGAQDDCWNTPQYYDLNGDPVSNKSLYSIVLPDKAVIGFNKTKYNQILIIVDINGKAGNNRLGREVFVFNLYNNKIVPQLCSEEHYKESFVKNGIHLGGFDRCGIPHDLKSYNDLKSNYLDDGCNKDAPINPLGLGIGVGAACSAYLETSQWTIDKNYPW